jgi:hypothetical protein
LREEASYGGADMSDMDDDDDYDFDQLDAIVEQYQRNKQVGFSPSTVLQQFFEY